MMLQDYVTSTYSIRALFHLKCLIGCLVGYGGRKGMELTLNGEENARSTHEAGSQCDGCLSSCEGLIDRVLGMPCTWHVG